MRKVGSEGEGARSPFGEMAGGRFRFLEISQSLLSPSLSSYHKLIRGLLLIFCTPDVGCSWGRDSETVPARSWDGGGRDTGLVWMGGEAKRNMNVWL